MAVIESCLLIGHIQGEMQKSVLDSAGEEADVPISELPVPDTDNGDDTRQ
jgi:hypothetical protein